MRFANKYNKKRFAKSNEDEVPEPTDMTSQDLEDLMSGNHESVSVESNRIYFYSDITRSSALQLNKALRETELMLLHRALELGDVGGTTDPGNIILHINSDGGEVNHSLAVSDYIRRSRVPVYTVVEGMCASGATFASIVGARRLINANSFMMIHQISGNLFGTFDNMKDEMYNCQLLMTIMKGLYKRYTKLPMKVLEETLRRDLLLTPTECLKYSLVDEII